METNCIVSMEIDKIYCWFIISRVFIAICENQNKLMSLNSSFRQQQKNENKVKKELYGWKFCFIYMNYAHLQCTWLCICMHPITIFITHSKLEERCSSKNSLEWMRKKIETNKIIVMIRRWMVVKRLVLFVLFVFANADAFKIYNPFHAEYFMCVCHTRMC